MQDGDDEDTPTRHTTSSRLPRPVWLHFLFDDVAPYQCTPLHLCWGLDSGLWCSWIADLLWCRPTSSLWCPLPLPFFQLMCYQLLSVPTFYAKSNVHNCFQGLVRFPKRNGVANSASSLEALPIRHRKYSAMLIRMIPAIYRWQKYKNCLKTWTRMVSSRCYILIHRYFS